MHHGTNVTYLPCCKPGSLPSGYLWSRWQVKRSRRMRNPQFHISGKGPICSTVSTYPDAWLCMVLFYDIFVNTNSISRTSRYLDVNTKFSSDVTRFFFMKRCIVLGAASVTSNWEPLLLTVCVWTSEKHPTTQIHVSRDATMIPMFKCYWR